MAHDRGRQRQFARRGHGWQSISLGNGVITGTAGATVLTGNAVYFDGNDDYAVTAAPLNLSGYHKIVVEAFVNYNNVDHDSLMWELTSNYNGSNTGFGYFTNHKLNTDMLSLNGLTGYNTGVYDRAGEGQWHHVVTVFNKTGVTDEVDLYIDGALKVAKSRPRPASIPTTSATNCFIS